MANKVSDNSITNKHQDWGLDVTNNLPYSGQAVQDYIKRELDSKVGDIHVINNKIYLFADAETKTEYLTNNDPYLVIGIIDLTDLYSSIDNIETNINSVEDLINSLETNLTLSITNLESEIETHKAQTNNLFESVEQEFEEVTSNFQNQIDVINTTSDTIHKEVQTNTQNVNSLINTVNEHQLSIDGHSELILNINSVLGNKADKTSITTITNDLDSLESTVTTLDTRITNLEETTVEGSIEELKNVVTEHTTAITTLNEEVDTLQTSNSTIIESIDDLNTLVSSKADSSEINTLNSSITTLRTQLGNLNESVGTKASQAQVTALQTTVDAHTEILENFDPDSGGSEEDILALQQAVTDLEGNVTSLTEAQASITASVSSLGAKIETKASVDQFNSLDNLYTELEGRVTINETNITNTVSKSTYESDINTLNTQYSEVVQDVNGINTTILDMDGEITSIQQSIDGITVSVGDIEADVESLKKQNDGSISSHFAAGEPTSENYPANEWYNAATGVDERNNHVGDLYYDTVSGFAYRYLYDNSTSTYYWLKITDTDITEALELAAQALAAADGKSTTFVKDLTVDFDDYEKGDIWILPSDLGGYAKGTLLVCVKDDEGSFSWNDWEDQLKYVDSSALNDLKSEINEAIEDGVLSAEERISVQAALTSFESMFADLTAEKNHLTLTFASSTSIENLNTCYTLLKTYYDSLIDSIEEILNAETITDDLKAAYETALSNYNGYFETYRESVEAVKESINQTLNGANVYLENVIADGVVTPIEKIQLRETKRQLVNEFTNNKTAAINYDIIDSNGVINTNGQLTTDDGDTYFIVYGNYKTAYNNLIGFFQNNLKVDESSTTTTIEDGYVEDLNNLFESYNETLISFVEIIEILQKKYNESISKVEELANNLSSELTIDESITKIGKGVVLSSIIGVQKDGVLKAGLIASDNADTDEEGNKILIASGIPEGEDADWNESTFVVYDNGNVKLNSVNLGDFQIDEHKRLISRIDDGLGVYDIILSSHGVNGARYHTDGTALFHYNIGTDSTFYADYSPDEDLVERCALTLEGRNTALALDIPKGNVRGLRPIVRKITTDDELTWKDHTLIVDNSSAITLTLNDSVENGQCYKILHTTSYQVTISSSTSNIFCVNFSSGSSLAYDKNLYLSEKGVWYLTYFDGYWYMEKYSYNAE